jgi:hypothetical protein
MLMCAHMCRHALGVVSAEKSLLLVSVIVIFCFVLLLFSGTLGGIFSQILSGDDLVRERCIKFLTVKIKSLGHDIITKDAEELLISECKKVLQVKTISF